MKKLFAAPVIFAVLLIGCISVQAPGQVTPTQQAQQPPQQPQQFAADENFVAEPVYLGGLKPLSKTGPVVQIRVRMENNSLFFQDYFNPLVNASSREVTNFSQPSIIAFNIINNKTDLVDGAMVVETDFGPRKNSTSLIFADVYTTNNVFQKKGQKQEIAAYLHSNDSIVFDYGKVPVGEGFVVFLVFFPTSYAEPLAEDFENFYNSSKGWKNIRFLHRRGNETALVTQIKLFIE